MTTLNITAKPATTATTSTLVKYLRETEQDFEWYPTTATMISVIERHIRTMRVDHRESSNVLDCGAGDGRVLTALAGKNGNKYAIEKSTALINRQPNDIIPVGTDFHHATLIDKRVDIVFSNPPYSEYEAWAAKIIREANATDVYLIIPQRWESSTAIAHAIESRKAVASIIHAGDFLDAERAARAKVHIIHVDLIGARRSYHAKNPQVDPFDAWFNETFPKQPEPIEEGQDGLKKAINHEMVSGKTLIETLVMLYQRDMSKLQANYAAASSLDPDLLKELAINHAGLSKGIKERIKGLKTLYWREFFGNYASITDRLTTASRKRILESLSDNMAVDFSADNAYAITLWVIRNANHYYDSQLVDLVEGMVRQANIVTYKSNQRTFRDEEWRYGYCGTTTPDGLTHYQLEYRIVLERAGGISTSSWSWENTKFNGLSERAADLINDILAVAKTLGWTSPDTVTSAGHAAREWRSNKSQAFTCVNGDVLMEVKAFQNGNMHVKFSQKFMKRLNIEFGRLKGWLRNPVHAAEEMGIKPQEAAEHFGTTFQISHATSVLLLEVGVH
jgi:hypothetical protein